MKDRKRTHPECAFLLCNFLLSDIDLVLVLRRCPIDVTTVSSSCSIPPQGNTSLPEVFMNRILALGAVLLAVGFTVHAQTYTPLYDFSNPGDPSYPGVEFGALQQTLGGYIVTTAGDFVTAD